MREFIQLANAVKDSEGLGNMKQKITVFGSYVTDLMSRTPHLPLPAETVKGTVFSMSAGGKGFNQAIAAKKMDADVVMVTKMAKDPFGKPLSVLFLYYRRLLCLSGFLGRTSYAPTGH